MKDGIYKVEDMESEEKAACNICLLDGCGLPCEDGKRFCSKRHYHAAQHKQKKSSSSTATGVIWCMTLANEIIPVNALGFEAVIILSFDKVLGLFFFLAVVLVFVHNMGKGAGRQEVQALQGRMAWVECAEAPIQTERAS